MKVVNAGSLDLDRLLTELSATKRFFTSEKDFQLHLGWAMKEHGFEVCLEYDPGCFEANAFIDILVTKPRRVAIELKYKTARLNPGVEGNNFYLKNQAAQTIGRYDFCRDIERVENVVQKGKADRGFAILLTNDGSYWRNGREGLNCEMFRMYEGRTVSGELKWGAETGGSKNGREDSIKLCREYIFRWKPYSDLQCKNGEFGYLIVPVKPRKMFKPKVAKYQVYQPK